MENKYVTQLGESSPQGGVSPFLAVETVPQSTALSIQCTLDSEKKVPAPQRTCTSGLRPVAHMSIDFMLTVCHDPCTSNIMQANRFNFQHQCKMPEDDWLILQGRLCRYQIASLEMPCIPVLEQDVATDR